MSKKFELEIDGKQYRVYGKTLKDAFTAKDGQEFKVEIPDLWKNNKDKIVETDISKEIKEKEKLNSLLDKLDAKLNDVVFLEKFLKHLEEL